jgi:hypothetical protein
MSQLPVGPAASGPDCARPPVPAWEAPLVAEGWQRRNMTDARGAREAQELYESLGLEVRLEAPRATDFSSACAACALGCHQYLYVYTRSRAQAPQGERGA